MPSATAHFQEMHALSIRMLEAARADDWERVGELETQVANLRERLIAEGNDTLSAAAMAADAEPLAQQAALIQEILANSDEVRRYVQPHLEGIRHLLGEAASKRRLDQAYGIDEA